MGKGDLLGEFELYVLAALQHLGRDAYGVTVRAEIAQRTGRASSFGAVYATLERLADKGFVTFWIAHPDPTLGGRPRKCAMVTAAGQRAFAGSLRAFNAMVQGLSVNVRGGRTR